MCTPTINEGSTEGNIEVAFDQYSVQLEFDLYELYDHALLAIHDQVTNAWIWAVQILCAGDLNVIHCISSFQCCISWFQVQLNFLWALLHIHRSNGKQIGNLQFFIILLRKVQLKK